MIQYLIGTGGWAYFKALRKPALKAYAEIFNFVEVNYTFYKYPSKRMVQRWRHIVPKGFVFTVRCHKDLTHGVGLKPVDEAYEILSQMISVCRILGAPFLHLLTPASYVFDETEIRQSEDFFSSADLKGVRLAWEVRGPISENLLNLMRDNKIVHSVDLSKEETSIKSDSIYSRIFGKGKHNIYQFTDDELKEIDKKVVDAAKRKAIITWHGVKMTNDAARFKKYKETGKFLPVTAYTGIDSVEAVLQEDAKFPSTKAELIEHQGWKVIDLTPEKRIHLSELLSKVPDKMYYDVHEIIKNLRGAL
ncbi:MAG: DUF72 domain-containing protein [Candidatus Bathyarchaeota archaeon]|nr:MAG: DUF72 domain-containing protein [Candidatus Bathyarchaeota archaeon]